MFVSQVGFMGRTIPLISGVYGLIGVIGLVMCLAVVADKRLSSRNLWSGPLVLDMHASQRTLRHKILRTSCNCFHFHIFCYLFGFLQRHDMDHALGAISHVSQLQKSGTCRLFKSVAGVVLSQVTPLAVAHVGWGQVQHHL